MEEEPTQPSESVPRTYDFDNWAAFYQDALRYHTATHPDDNLVSDRIATLRRFMSERVINHLGTYVRPHPRYDTTSGWDVWVENVMDILRQRDTSIGHASTVYGWLSKFRMEQVTYLDLWDGLDVLVSTGNISSAEQRQLFWGNISWETQERLVTICPFFDLNHKVWAAPETAQADAAEQKISDTMETLKLNETVRQITRSMVWRVGIMISMYLALFLPAYLAYIVIGNIINLLFLRFMAAVVGLCFIVIPRVGPYEVARDFLRLNRMKKAQRSIERRVTF